MLIADFVRQRYAVERAITPGTASAILYGVKSFERFLGRRAVLSDLDDEDVNQWIRDLTERSAPKTAQNKRNEILAIWRFAASLRLVDPPGRIRTVRQLAPVPVAWSTAELGRLLTAAISLEGCLTTGAPRGPYFWCLFKSAYETGLRRGDLWQLRVDDVEADGTIRVVQGKTRDGHACRIQRDTHEQFHRLAKYSTTPLRWPMSTSTLYRWIRIIRHIAGVPDGALQQFRRSGATACEIESPGSAPRYCGHKTPSLAYRHYVDRTKLPIVSPPKIS